MPEWVHICQSACSARATSTGSSPLSSASASPSVIAASSPPHPIISPPLATPAAVGVESDAPGDSPQERTRACTSEWPPSSRTRAARARDREVYRERAARWPTWPSRSASSRSGASSTTSPTTRCAPTCCSSSPTWPAAPSTSQLGSMVVVLPWHDPMRVAEEVSMLDNLSDGRLILGLGPRRRARSSSTASALSMDESRERFVEYGARCCCDGLEQRLLRVRRRSSSSSRGAAIRPAPFKSLPRPHLRGGGLAGVGAHHGRARRRHPDHPAEAVGGGRARSSTTYRAIYREVNGADAPPPISAGWTFCDESADARARDGAPLHRRLLPDRARPLPVRGRPPRQDQGLRVLRQDGREDRDRTATDRRHRVLRRTCRCGARPSSATRRSWTSTRRTGNEPLRRRVQLRRHAATRRPSATCACSPREVMPALAKVGEAPPALRPATA